MSLNVIDRDNERQCFADANTWHIDERGNLHLSGGRGSPVASYAAGAWLSVGSVDAQPGAVIDRGAR
ncbi:MAG TPA: hypothetical protein VFL94_02115 [Actinomycetales bacterium]|nr:hypothetical protein [Actinomycetales bacterium]